MFEPLDTVYRGGAVVPRYVDPAQAALVRSPQWIAARDDRLAAIVAAAPHAQRVGGGDVSGVGLVPSINNVKTCGSVDTREVIEVDKNAARCTRLRKNLGVAAKMLCQGETRTAWMVTLTYADATAWRPSHVRDALRHLRQWAHRQGFKLRYLWVMETQDRKSGHQIGMDAPHYHLVVWVPGGVDLPCMDSMGWWPHGMTNTVRAVAPVRYVMKYASKFDSEGKFPKGARVYGIGGLEQDHRHMRRWINWPSMIQGNGSYTCRWRRAVGGGWVNPQTGEVLASEWGLTASTRKSTRLVRLCKHPRLIDSPAGPFSFISFQP